MAVGARAQEAGVLSGNLVHGRQAMRVAQKLHLGLRLGEVERWAAMLHGDIQEEIVYRCDPDDSKHLLAVGVGVRRVWGGERVGHHQGFSR